MSCSPPDAASVRKSATSSACSGVRPGTGGDTRSEPERSLPQPVERGGVGEFPGRTPEEPTRTELEIRDRRDPWKRARVALVAYIEGGREPEFIGGALHAIPLHHLANLQEVRLSHNQVFVGNEEANAAYRVDEKVIELGRIHRFWDGRSPQASARARETLYHEVGHHWFREHSSAEFFRRMEVAAEKLDFTLMGKREQDLDELIGRAYSLWLTQPGKLADSAPEVYDLLSDYAFSEMQ